MAQREKKVTELEVPEASCFPGAGFPSPSSAPCAARDPKASGPIQTLEASEAGKEGRSGEDTVAPVNPAPATVKAVKRCSGCGKRVGLTGFRCRCGELFCGEHRYSDRHACSYDYKAAGRAAIERENPLVRAAKIVKV